MILFVNMIYKNWRDELYNSFKNISDISPDFSLSPEQKVFFKTYNTTETLSFLVTPYYFSLTHPGDVNDPIGKQFLPDSREFNIKPYEQIDPLAEAKYTVSPGLVHRYRDRCILKVTDMCAVHCRFCFRRLLKKGGVLNREHIKEAAQYISCHREIKEVLLSGGDPFILEDSKIDSILKTIKKINKNITIRIGTRCPVVLPQRITKNLLGILKQYAPIWIITHFNHPREITEQSKSAVSLLLNAGIPVLNQTVLLKNINHRVEILEKLFQDLVHLRVKPYYLFQGDLASGTSHFRISISRGLTIFKSLKTRLSGISLPRYVLDLPEGGGKVILSDSIIKKVDNNWFYIENNDNELFKYPNEE